MTTDEQARQQAIIQIQVTLGLTLFTIIGGMVFYHLVEKLSWLDSWYFVIITLTTVGYGDISPSTPLGKLATPIFILIGIGLIASIATGVNKMIINHRVRRQEKRLKRKTPKK